MKKAIWVTWEVQRRNIGLSSGLGVQQYTIESSKRRLLRYAESIFKTAKILYRERPDIVFAQNPSTVLALLLLMLRPFCFEKVILDAHNIAIYPMDQGHSVLNRLAKFLQKRTDLTLVTNSILLREIERNGGRAHVIFDRIPESPAVKKIDVLPGWSIAFICTFARDEPYERVFESARLLPKNITIYVTGNFSSKIIPASLPKNLILMGFLAEDKYWGLLSSCHLVMDLTTRKDCLVCGAYEGIAVGKPLILSDTQATRELFNRGCEYVAPTAESIREGILRSIAHYEDNVKEIPNLKCSLERSWKSAMDALRKMTLENSF